MFNQNKTVAILIGVTVFGVSVGVLSDHITKRRHNKMTKQFTSLIMEINKFNNPSEYDQLRQEIDFWDIAARFDSI